MSSEITPTRRPKQEPADLQPRSVLIGAAAIVTTVLLVTLIAHLLISFAGPTPDTSVAPPVGGPTRLSSRPTDEIAVFEREKQSRLRSYGWVDRERGVAHVPIERAMQMMASQHASGEPPQ